MRSTWFAEAVRGGVQAGPQAGPLVPSLRLLCVGAAATPLTGRLALGHGQHAVMIGVGAVEPLKRPRPHLLERDEALIAEHPRAEAAGPARTFRAARRRRTVGSALRR